MRPEEILAALQTPLPPAPPGNPSMGAVPRPAPAGNPVMGASQAPPRSGPPGNPVMGAAYPELTADMLYDPMTNPLVRSTADWIMQSPVLDTAVTGVEEYLNALAAGGTDSEAIRTALGRTGGYIRENALNYAIPGGNRPENRSWGEVFTDAPPWQMMLADFATSAVDFAPAATRTGRKVLIHPTRVDDQRPLGPVGEARRAAEQGVGGRQRAAMESVPDQAGAMGPVARGSIMDFRRDAVEAVLQAAPQQLRNAWTQSPHTYRYFEALDSFLDNEVNSVLRLADDPTAAAQQADIFATTLRDNFKIPEDSAILLGEELLRRATHASTTLAGDRMHDFSRQAAELLGSGPLSPTPTVPRQGSMESLLLDLEEPLARHINMQRKMNDPVAAMTEPDLPTRTSPAEARAATARGQGRVEAANRGEDVPPAHMPDLLPADTLEGNALRLFAKGQVQQMAQSGMNPRSMPPALRDYMNWLYGSMMSGQPVTRADALGHLEPLYGPKRARALLDQSWPLAENGGTARIARTVGGGDQDFDQFWQDASALTPEGGMPRSALFSGMGDEDANSVFNQIANEGGMVDAVGTMVPRRQFGELVAELGRTGMLDPESPEGGMWAELLRIDASHGQGGIPLSAIESAAARHGVNLDRMWANIGGPIPSTGAPADALEELRGPQIERGDEYLQALERSINPREADWIGGYPNMDAIIPEIEGEALETFRRRVAGQFDTSNEVVGRVLQRLDDAIEQGGTVGFDEIVAEFGTLRNDAPSLVETMWPTLERTADPLIREGEEALDMERAADRARRLTEGEDLLRQLPDQQVPPERMQGFLDSLDRDTDAFAGPDGTALWYARDEIEQAIQSGRTVTLDEFEQILTRNGVSTDAGLLEQHMPMVDENLAALTSPARAGAATFRQLGPDEAEQFTTSLSSLGPGKGDFVTQYTPEQMRDMIETQGYRAYLSPDGAGYLIDPNGDLQAVHNAGRVRGLGRQALQDAIANGARTLDAFDVSEEIAGVNLPTLYGSYGFQEVGRVAWDDQYAPPNWDYEKYGRPDVVFMRYGGEAAE